MKRPRGARWAASPLHPEHGAGAAASPPTAPGARRWRRDQAATAPGAPPGRRAGLGAELGAVGPGLTLPIGGGMPVEVEPLPSAGGVDPADGDLEQERDVARGIVDLAGRPVPHPRLEAASELMAEQLDRDVVPQLA
jgi:hypothetical protein